MKGPHPVTSGLVAGRGDDAFFFYVGLGFRTAAPGVHSSVVNAEDHTVPEALATRHRALGRDGKREREKTHRQSPVYFTSHPRLTEVYLLKI